MASYPFFKMLEIHGPYDTLVCKDARMFSSHNLHPSSFVNFTTAGTLPSLVVDFKLTVGKGFSPECSLIIKEPLGRLSPPQEVLPSPPF